MCLTLALDTSLFYIHQNLTSDENCALLDYYAARTTTHCIVSQNSALLIYLWQKPEIAHLISHHQNLLKKINIYYICIEICVTYS